MTDKFVVYTRVSTTSQGVSGLGLEAQTKAIETYLSGRDHHVVGRYQEIESGRQDARPALAAALRRCKDTGAKLIIGRLDRLARRVSFISAIMDSDVEFVACDMPVANRLTIHVMAAMAEYEADAVSKRTKDSLGEIKAKLKRGEVYVSRAGNTITGLGMNNIGGRSRPDLGTKATKAKADAFAQRMGPTIVALRQSGLPLAKIAAQMNDLHVETPRKGTWTAMSVSRVLDREAA